MRNALLLGILAAGIACTQQSTSNPNYGRAPGAPPSASPSAPPSSAQPSLGQTQTGSSASQATELSGELKSIDKDKRSLTISSTTGGEKDVKLADSATITRDGASVGLDQLKEGDDVRASFDAATNQATSLEVHSKKLMAPKEMPVAPKGMPAQPTK